MTAQEREQENGEFPRERVEAAQRGLSPGRLKLARTLAFLFVIAISVPAFLAICVPRYHICPEYARSKIRHEKPPKAECRSD